MAEFKLSAGATIDLLTKGEMDDSLAKAAQAAEYEKLRGIKWMRLPETLTGKGASSKLSLGVDQGQPALGPRSGYAWVFKRLVVNGLTSGAGGATPDVVNLYHDGETGVPMWQFNGNNFGYTFGKLEVTLMGGETLALASVGTFAATGQITLGGELIECPAELLAKLA